MLMKYFQAASLLLFCATSTIARADAQSEFAAFSAFGQIDIAELAQGDVRTMSGPPMGGRFLSVQSCFVAPGSPQRQIEALRRWDPTKHRELKVFLHGDLTASPAAANFSKIKNAPDNSSVNSFVTATKDHKTTLQISKEEAKKLPTKASEGGTIPGEIVAFWSDLLAGRSRSFVSGGTASQAPYDYDDEKIRPNDEINSLLKQQDKIRKQFS